MSRRNGWFGVATRGVAAIALAVAAGAVLTATAGAAPRGVSCRQVTPLVALAEGGPLDTAIGGTLCLPKAGHVKSVDVLVHGATYNRSYWDFPGNYSYVNKTMRARPARATFAYDRVGAGRSIRPLSTSVTADAEAYILHQLIGLLRKVHGFRTVNIVGHSLGAMIGIQESARYNDADRLVVTSFLHSLGPALVSGLKYYPADQDPKFAGKGYDAGYLTSQPGARTAFYDPGSAEAWVIDYDENHKDVLSSTLLADGQAQRKALPASNPTSQIRIPVLVVAGANDQLYCNIEVMCGDISALWGNERQYYSSSRSFTVVVIQGTGHDLALHPSADESFRLIHKWLSHS